MKFNQQIRTILPLAAAMGSVALSVSSANAADSFRPSINVAVSLRTVGGSFVEIHDTGAVGTGGNVNQVEITEDNGAALLGSGIDSVRFDFGNPGLNWTFYRELDVVGTATVVPEPTTTALLGLGGLALILRRRK